MFKISSKKLIISDIVILYNILKQISSNQDIEQIKNIKSFENINKYSLQILNINVDRIKTYITLLINLFYIKKK
jgi:hypothetical protein